MAALPFPGRIYETWMVCEYCERGNLTDAITQGRFYNPANQELDMVRHCRLLMPRYIPSQTFGLALLAAAACHASKGVPKAHALSKAAREPP